MMASYRTPADREPLPPAIRVLVKRVMADPALSAGSRTVMVWLLMEGRDEAPAAPDMGHHVGLTERSVRRAYAELREAGWLDPRRDWSETPRGDTPERQAILDGARSELSDGFPSFADHIATLERLRDRALAKGDDRTALSAQVRLGRALGYDRNYLSAPGGRGEVAPQARVRCGGAADGAADETVRAAQTLPPPSQMGEGRGGGDAGSTPEAPGTGPLPTLPHAVARGRANTGPEPAETGPERDKAGPNWRELAGIGRVDSGHEPEKLRPINDLLEKPIYGTEAEWLDTPENRGERPFWLNGMPRVEESRSGQNCPREDQARAVS